MIVDLLHEENDKAANTGFSFVSRDKLSKWSSMKEEDINRIINTCAYMDAFPMQCDAATDLAKHQNGSFGRNAKFFYLSTYRRCWNSVLLFLDKDSIDDYCSINSQKNYDEYMKKHKEFAIDEALANSELLKTALVHYDRWFVKCFNNALEEGYDWDVVTRMARIEISKERFRIVVQM